MWKPGDVVFEHNINTVKEDLKALKVLQPGEPVKWVCDHCRMVNDALNCTHCGGPGPTSEGEDNARQPLVGTTS